MYQKTICYGRVGNDPEMRSEKAPVSFSLATSESYKDDQGEWQTNTTWHNIVAWGSDEYKQNLMSRIHKGSVVLIEGKNVYEKYEKDGQEKYVTKIKALVVKVIEAVKSEPRGGSGTYSPPASNPAEVRKPTGNPAGNDFDDDLPF